MVRDGVRAPEPDPMEDLIRLQRIGQRVEAGKALRRADDLWLVEGALEMFVTRREELERLGVDVDAEIQGIREEIRRLRAGRLARGLRKFWTRRPRRDRSRDEVP